MRVYISNHTFSKNVEAFTARSDDTSRPGGNVPFLKSEITKHFFDHNTHIPTLF